MNPANTAKKRLAFRRDLNKALKARKGSKKGTCGYNTASATDLLGGGGAGGYGMCPASGVQWKEVYKRHAWNDNTCAARIAALSSLRRFF